MVLSKAKPNSKQGWISIVEAVLLRLQFPPPPGRPNRKGIR